MRQSIIVDTGPLYAAADRDDQHHRRAQRELERLNREKNELIVAYPMLLESYTLVLYRLGKQAAATWLGEVTTGAAFLNPTPEDYRDAAKKVQSFTDQEITLFDATIAVLAGRLDLMVWTYDHHFDVMRAPVWR